MPSHTTSLNPVIVHIENAGQIWLAVTLHFIAFALSSQTCAMQRPIELVPKKPRFPTHILETYGTTLTSSTGTGRFSIDVHPTGHQ